MMWFLLLLYSAHIEPVFSQGDVNRLILKSGNNPCEGHVEIYHNGVWGHVGNKYWSTNTEQVVCRSIHCGEPKSSMDGLRSPAPVWLNEMKCNGNENHLWDCENPGWNISVYLNDVVKHIKCSNEIKISLHEFTCAGAVQYSINGQGHSGYFCDDNWGQTEANFLCGALGCGTAIPQEEQMVWKGSNSSGKMMKIQCTDIEHLDNLWQCVTQQTDSCSNPASVTCTGFERLQLKGSRLNVCRGSLQKEENGKWVPVKKSTKLKVSPDEWCKQMHCGTTVSHSQDNSGTQLKCSDKVTVVLKDNNKPSECYGAVHIRVNATDHPVCASRWTEKDAQVVCEELKCGDVLSSSTKSNIQDGIMDNVKCSGSESSLWHCRATRDNKPFSCSSIAYVVCAGSVNATLMDGPGPCAGRVEIHYEGQWRRVATQGWTDTNSDTVCSQLGCGKSRKSANSDKFSQGSGDFLTKAVNCNPDASHISQCVTDNSVNPRGETGVVAITCEEHKVVFLDGGNSACSGKVGIEHGSKTYWLSGSTETWNQDAANTVCRQKHCGEAFSRTSSSSADMMKDVWDQSFSCSSNTTSLFECENATLPSDYNDTIATVTCSGNIQVNLTERCWGNVNVCVGGVCGGVCKDTWTNSKSEMLCENLGCGNAIPGANSSPEKTEVTIMSLHMRPRSTNLNQSSVIRKDKKDGTCNRNPAYVVCSGCVKARIIPTRYKCSGNVEAYLEGQWLPVCSDALKDIETQNTICRELGCGQAVGMVDYFGPKSATAHVISQISQCPANGKGSLTACNIVSGKRTCTLGALRCSSWSKMELKFNKACSGAVFVYSEGNKNAVSAEGWTETEGHRLCRELQCGNLESNTTTTVRSVRNRNFNCSSVENPQNIWDCEKPMLPQQKKQVFIKCQDEPSVTLSETCSGEVKINGIRVCSSGWKEAYSHLVCQEQNCSNAIFTVVEPNKPDEQYHHVRCEDHHQTLGQCDRFKGTCDGALVSVFCVKNVNFSTSEHCGGAIEVNYRNTWENVCAPLISSQVKEKLCQELGCGGYNGSIVTINKQNPVKLETTLDCSAGQKDIRHCVSPKRCGSDVPAEIYCYGYVEKPADPGTKTPVVLIILTVGFSLVLVILIVVFVQVCIVRKAKRPVGVSSRVISRKEAEFESGDYEDVTSNANEMEDFCHGRFRSEAEVITESEARSTSSFPYDDIDEATEAQPLTFQATTAAASGDKDSHEDGVTYEVEDPQENYDDIELSPEITQTKAEVHEGAQTTPESVAVAPPCLVRGDEDYLIPGQDG